MKKIWRLLVIVTSFVPLIVGISTTAAAQDAYWQLEKIEVSGCGYGCGLPGIPGRQTKLLPLDTRERRGIAFGPGNGRVLKADVSFPDLMQRVTRRDVWNKLDVSIKAEVVGEGPEYAAFRCFAEAKTPSGFVKSTFGGFFDEKVKTGEIRDFDCRALIGADMPEEDYTLTFRLLMDDAGPRYARRAGEEFYKPDVSFHFFYKWKGPAGGNERNAGGPCSPKDGDIVLTDRESLATWAKGQNVSTLDSILRSKTETAFKCTSLTTAQLTDLYARISVFIAYWASGDQCFPGDKMAASIDQMVHKRWVSQTDKGVVLNTLQRKIAAGLACANGFTRESLFADIADSINKAGS